MRYGIRGIDPVEFSEGKRREISIPKKGILRELISEFGFDHAITGGSGAGAVQADPAFRTHERVQVLIEGAGADKTLHDLPGHTLGVIDRLLGEQETPQIDPTDISAGGSTSGCKATVPIPFYVPRSSTPDECALPCAVAKPRLVIDWAHVDELVTAAQDGAGAYSNTETDLFPRMLYGVAAQPYTKWSALSLRSTQFEVTVTGSKPLELSHLRPGMDLVRVIIEAFATGAAGAQFDPNDALITQLELEVNGVKEFEDAPWATLQRLNAKLYQLTAVETGVVILDFAEDGLTGRGNVIKLEGAAAPVISLDYVKQTGECKIVVTTMAIRRGIIPVPPKVARGRNRRGG